MEQHIAIGKYDVPVRQLVVAIVAGLILGGGGLVALPPSTGKVGTVVPTNPNGSGPESKPEDTGKVTPTKPEPTKPQAPTELGKTYAEARAKHPTKLTKPAPSAPKEAPKPPANLLSITYPQSPADGQVVLEAWWGPKVRPGTKVSKPGILLLPAGNQFSAEIVKDADPSLTLGHIVMVPFLRGQVDKKGSPDLFREEIEDVVAAADRLRDLSYVKGNPVYAGGYKEGGTRALLGAMLDGGRTIKGVAVVAGHTEPRAFFEGNDAVRFDDSDDIEWRMRTPLEFARSLKVPALLLYPPGNTELQAEYERFKEAAPAGKVTVQEATGESFQSATAAIKNFFDGLTKKASEE